MDKDLFILIDSHALIYRAFYAFPPLTTSQGQLINAAYGFARILLTVIKDLQPKYLVAAFDLPKPTFRHTEFVGYKAQRKEMPEELQSQIAIVKEVIEALNIPLLAIEGYEADDIIGTIAKQVTDTSKTNQNLQVLIVTGDRDSFQLVNDDVHIFLPGNGKNSNQELGTGDVIKKMGVRPDQIVDFKALSGDASDNIPGVKGIGAKTAVRLLNEFDSVQNIYQQVQTKSEQVQNSTVLKGAVLKKIVEGYEQALMSQHLAQIDVNVPIAVKLEDCRVAGYDKQLATQLFEKYEFGSLLKHLPSDDFELGVQEAFF